MIALYYVHIIVVLSQFSCLGTLCGYGTLILVLGDIIIGPYSQNLLVYITIGNKVRWQKVWLDLEAQGVFSALSALLGSAFLWILKPVTNRQLVIGLSHPTNPGSGTDGGYSPGPIPHQLNSPRGQLHSQYLHVKSQRRTLISSVWAISLSLNESLGPREWATITILAWQRTFACGWLT